MSDLLHRRARPRLVRLVGLALATFGLLAAIGTDRAGAGTYTVAECHPAFGAGHDDASFRRTSRDFAPRTGCAKGGGGITVAHRRSHTLANRSGTWTFPVPPGTHLVEAIARAGGTAAGGLVPELLVRVGSALHRVAVASGAAHAVSWSGRARALVGRLGCTRAPSCAPTRQARLQVDRLRLRLDDTAAPSVSLGGSIGEGAVVRDVRRVEAIAGDVGGGVRRISVTVNGHPAGTTSTPCALSGSVALRTVPCPPSERARFEQNTTAPPYRQGPNSVRVCAADFAARNGANERCATRRVRVDNACPISAVTTGTRLRAHVAGLAHGSVARRGERPRMAGRLRNSLGAPVRGARVCVAGRVRMAGAREHLIARPTTDRSGRFSAVIPPGPARRLRIAYWPGSYGALERFAKLRFSARPTFEIRPHGGLRTGQRAVFMVRLRPPFAARRTVRIEARSQGRWVPVTSGRTGGRGVYKGAYRFHATHGRRTYRFRAVVPRQAGYPYASGASAVRRKVVRGR